MPTQNFDALTPPALPAGWTGDLSAFATETAFHVSAPNGLQGTGAGPNMIFAPDVATGWGDEMAGWFGISGGAVAGPVLHCQINTANAFAAANGKCYFLQMSPLDNMVHIYKRTGSGGQSELGSGVSVAGGVSDPSTDKYFLKLKASGTNTLDAIVQRGSDSKYLQTDGSWGASAVSCETVTDGGTLFTTGYRGIVQAFATCYNDDVEWQDLSLSVAITNPTSGEAFDQGAGLTCTATVTNFISDNTVTWSFVTNNSGGTINGSSGAYVAGRFSSAGVSDTIRATSNEDATKHADVVVNVNAVHLTLTPSSPGIAPGGAVLLTAHLTGTNLTSVGYTAPDGGGSLFPPSGASTTFTAGPNNGTFRVVATHTDSGGTYTVTAHVRVGPTQAYQIGMRLPGAEGSTLPYAEVYLVDPTSLPPTLVGTYTALAGGIVEDVVPLGAGAVNSGNFFGCLGLVPPGPGQFYDVLFYTGDAQNASIGTEMQTVTQPGTGNIAIRASADFGPWGAGQSNNVTAYVRSQDLNTGAINPVGSPHIGNAGGVYEKGTATGKIGFALASIAAPPLGQVYIVEFELTRNSVTVILPGWAQPAFTSPSIHGDGQGTGGKGRVIVLRRPRRHAAG